VKYRAADSVVRLLVVGDLPYSRQIVLLLTRSLKSRQSAVADHFVLPHPSATPAIALGITSVAVSDVKPGGPDARAKWVK